VAPIDSGVGCVCLLLASSRISINYELDSVEYSVYKALMVRESKNLGFGGLVRVKLMVDVGMCVMGLSLLGHYDFGQKVSSRFVFIKCY